MKVKSYYDGRIINLIYPSQYSLTSALLRVQEFYESPISAIRGKKFTFEEFFDAFDKQHKGENYFTKWNGFNIPGVIVRKFIREFTARQDFWEKEHEWITAVKELSGKRKFYLIGSHTGDKDHDRVVDHELAHAFYYLNKDYYVDMHSLYYQWNKANLKKVYKTFKKDGYSIPVYEDELQAYYCTSPMHELKKWKMDTGISEELLKRYRETFKEYKNKLIK